MSDNVLNGLRLLGNLFKTIPDALDKLIELPKRKLARELFRFYEGFEQVEPALLELISGIETLKMAQTVGAQIHYAYQLGECIAVFQTRCLLMVKWLRDREDWKNAFEEVSTPEVRKTLNNTQPSDDYALLEYAYEVNDEYDYEQSFDLVSTFAALKYELQAIRSPNPRFFADSERLEEIVSQLDGLGEAIRETTDALRKFASIHLTVKAFFDSKQYSVKGISIGNNETVSESKALQHSVSADFLNVLACPACKGDLKLYSNAWLICQNDNCNLKYPVAESIPIMLVEEGAKWKYVSPEDLPLPPIY